jgi:fatty acid desaturase
MSLGIIQDERVRAIKWRDLARVSWLETAKELTLSTPWLAASLLLAHKGLYVPALLCSFFFYLAGLRQVHNAFHFVLGVSRAACHWAMFILSVLMLGSMHAVQVNHLRHHRHCMDDDDEEARCARHGAWRAILEGPLFPLRMHWKALQVARPELRRWIVAELAANAVWIALVFGFLEVTALKYHVIVMAVGQCLSSFFCVWTVHHDCDRSHFIARTIRSPFKNALTMNMLYHTEHHLFPAVPTCHLPQLAERLDRAAPELASRLVF